MKFADATMDIRPRTDADIVDLALRFYRAHFGLLLTLSLIFNGPVLIISAVAHSLSDTALLAAGILLLFTPLSFGAVVLASSRLVFGEPMTITSTLRRYGKVAWRFVPGQLLRALICIVTAPLFVGYLLHLSTVLSPMIVLLEDVDRRTLKVRRQNLSRRAGGNPFSFEMILLAVVGVMMLGLVALLEVMTGDVFALWDTGLRTWEVLSDPFRFAIWAAVWVVLFPVVALGWFFRYLDARIRSEGWDLELSFRETAARLMTTRMTGGQR